VMYRWCSSSPRKVTAASGDDPVKPCLSAALTPQRRRWTFILM
jgi:hypothetical protein